MAAELGSSGASAASLVCGHVPAANSMPGRMLSVVGGGPDREGHVGVTVMGSELTPAASFTTSVTVTFPIMRPLSCERLATIHFYEHSWRILSTQSSRQAR